MPKHPTPPSDIRGRPLTGKADLVWGCPRRDPFPILRRRYSQTPDTCLHLCLDDHPSEGVTVCAECGERFPIDPDDPKNDEVCGQWGWDD
jgi:hypothetical protein